LRGEGKYDGVFGLWYGKGPGVDRSGDVMRHANMAGTSPNGGVLMAMGDDHTGESSTTLHQSDWAMVDAYMPVLSPAGVQEVLDFGLYGYALSRFAGVWVGLKTMKDTVEATAVVDGDPHRMQFVTPDFKMPDGGLNIRLIDTPQAQEARMIDFKRFAAEAFARANGIDRRVWGKPGAKIGLVAAGKNWLDLTHALGLLGIDAARPNGWASPPTRSARPGRWTCRLPRLGRGAGPDRRGRGKAQADRGAGQGGDLRRPPRPPRLWLAQGRHLGDGRRLELFPTRYALDPILIAEKLGEILIEEGRGTDASRPRLHAGRGARADNAQDLAARLPYFCSGCPHNTSTKVPEGSAPMPASAATTWCSGWTAARSASPRWAARARTGSARRRSPSASTCSRTSATAPTTTRASRRSARPSRRAPTSPTRSCSTTPSP
jgi:indolepyruvate ferredoxin oxidoreductase